MSPYPVLNNRPIDQWKVIELKDELRRRKLPVKGLKDDLVKRLNEAIQIERAVKAEEPVNETPPAEDMRADGTLPAEDVKLVETPVADARVNQAPVEPNIDEGPSEDRKQDEAPIVTQTEISQETAVAMPKNNQEAVLAIGEFSQEIVVAVAEVNEAPVVDVAAADEASVCEAAPTKREEPESILSDNTIVKKVHPQTEGNTEPVIEKSPEVGTGKKMVVDDVPSDVMANDAISDITSAEGKPDVNVECKIQEQETVLPSVDTTASHADPVNTDVANARENNNEVTMVPNNDLNDGTLIHDEECKDSNIMNKDSKPILSEPNDQVPEVNTDLGSHIKSASISNDNITMNEKSNITDNSNAHKFDLELELKPEMVKPSSSIPSIGDVLQPLDDGEELVKNQASLEEMDSATNMDSNKKEDSLEGGSPEKLNLDRSSGDESMEEDVMESKQAESNIKTDDLGGKIEVSSEHVVKEVVTLPDAVIEGSFVEVVAEEKPAAPTEKRKLEAQEVVANNDPIKRQRRWNEDNIKVPERQSSNLSGSDASKDVFQPALKCSFGRSDSTASGDSPKERIVPPPHKPLTTSLRIDRFVRPFTLKAVQELLANTGSVCSFWMDHIKTHCYVTYSSVEEAVATRNAVYNLQWPPNNGNHLVAEFVDPQEVNLKLEAPPLSPPPISPSTATTSRAGPIQQAQANQTMPPQAASTRERLPPPPPLTKPPTLDPGSVRERLPPTPKKPEPPVVTLDDLFRKTKASPRIYYLPLSEEEVAAKLATQGKGKGE